MDSKTNYTTPLQTGRSKDIDPLFFKEWFIFRQERHFGPFTQEKIKKLLSSGHLSGKHHFWKSGQQDWVLLEDDPQFFGYVKAESIGLSDLQFEQSFDYIGDPLGEEAMGAGKKRMWHEWVSRLDLQAGITAAQGGVAVSSKPEGLWSQLKNPFAMILFCYGMVDRAQKKVRSLLQQYPKTIYGLALGVVGILGYQFMVLYGVRSLENYSKIPQADRSKATAILVKRLTKLRPKFLAVTASISKPNLTGNSSLSSESVNQLLIINNLHIGQKIRLRVASRQDKILGPKPLANDMTIPVTAKIMDIAGLMVKSGVEFSAGWYNLKIECVSCPINSVINQKQQLIFWGLPSSYAFDDVLDKYQKKLKARALLEINELAFILDALRSQWSTLSGIVLSIDSANPRSRKNIWLKLRSDWATVHAEITDAFSELNSFEFRSQLYYESYYVNLKSISEAILKKYNWVEKTVKERSKINIWQEYSGASIKEELSLAADKINAIRNKFSSSKSNLPPPVAIVKSNS